MEPRISIVTIAVDDLDRAVRFYEAMGLKRHAGHHRKCRVLPDGRRDPRPLPAQGARKDAGVSSATAPQRVYLAYNTRSEAEVDEVLAAAEKAGGRIVKPAQRAFWGGWYGYFADPEGHLWEVAHNPDFPIDAEGQYLAAGTSAIGAMASVD